MNMLGNIADCVIAVMAVLAGVISYIELKSHQQKENNKLLSQLNKRYLRNENIQNVVRYLREINPSDKVPEPYDTELFFRFFEELGVYIAKGNLPKDDVKTFFGYYLKRMYETDKGQKLRDSINNEDKELKWLQWCKKAMDIV